MRNYLSKEKVNITTAIYAAIAVILTVWASYLFRYFIYLLPICLACILYYWADKMETYFGENMFVTSAIVGSILLLLIGFVVIPNVDVAREGLYISIANFGVIYKGSGYLLKIVICVVLMLAIFFGCLLLLYYFKDKVKDFTNTMSRNSFDEEIDTIISYFNGKKATSSKKTVTKSAIFDNKAFDFLVKNKVIVQKGSKYYLDKKAVDIIGEKTDIKYDIRFIIASAFVIICLCVLTVLTFNKNVVYDYNVVGDYYSFVAPKDYIASSNDSTFVFIPKSDISGQTGAIYITVYALDEPATIDHKNEVESSRAAYSTLDGLNNYTNDTYLNDKSMFVVSNDMQFEDRNEKVMYVYVEKDNLCYKVLRVDATFKDVNSFVEQNANAIVNSIGLNDTADYSITETSAE